MEPGHTAFNLFTFTCDTCYNWYPSEKYWNTTRLRLATYIKEIGSIWKKAAQDFVIEVWPWVDSVVHNCKVVAILFGIPYCVWNYGILAVAIGSAILLAVTTMPYVCYSHAKNILKREGALQTRKQQGRTK